MPALLLCISLCVLSESEHAAEESPVNFAEHIAPIVHSKCSNCHREGQPGPFPLITLDDIRDRGETIQAVVHAGYMPPWKPVNTDVQFAHDRRLTKREINLIDQWLDHGTPTGDLSTVQYPAYPGGWSLGQPDLVITMNGQFEVPAQGRDIYRSFVFEAGLPEDRWVKAVELRPKARGAVHHALFFVDTSGTARRQDGQDGRAGLSGMSFLRGGNRSDGGAFGIQGLGGYVPGSTPNKLPGDLAMFLPAGGDIVMQTHFHPSGKTEYEQAELALYFAERPPSRRLIPIQLPPFFGRLAGIDVPAGEEDFRISQSFTLPVDVDAIQVSGHAHYICREMLLTATMPNGQTIDLLTIDDWDLDWQDQYQFSQPVPLPAGTTLHAEISYDNSSDNPENPHSPPRRIQWGRESTDEMGSLTLQVVAASESDHDALVKATRSLIVESMGKRMAQGADLTGNNLRQWGASGALVQRLDRNGDGRLQASEIPVRIRSRVMNYADVNGDKVIDEEEIRRAQTALRGQR